MKRKLSILLTLFLLLGCTQKPSKQENQTMSIQPTQFSKETMDVLKMLNKDVYFFDIQLNDQAKSYKISTWIYDNGQWVERVNTEDGIEFLKERIAFRFKEDAQDIYFIDEQGYTSITYHDVFEFDQNSSITSWYTNQEEPLIMNKEKVLWTKISTNATSLAITDDFRSIDCEKGIAFTITIYDK